jgi:hypothetical protein
MPGVCRTAYALGLRAASADFDCGLLADFSADISRCSQNSTKSPTMRKNLYAIQRNCAKTLEYKEKAKYNYFLERM